jgi:threonine/homoserine/homoserine lactone efflux protein
MVEITELLIGQLVALAGALMPGPATATTVELGV